jgi:hypothetical protein
VGCAGGRAWQASGAARGMRRGQRWWKAPGAASLGGAGGRWWVSPPGSLNAGSANAKKMDCKGSVHRAADKIFGPVTVL